MKLIAKKAIIIQNQVCGKNLSIVYQFSHCPLEVLFAIVCFGNPVRE